MTIDEAIALVKIERECITRADICDRKCEKCDLVQDSNNLIDMYEQLAEWLELLKWYEQGMEDIPSESGVLPKDVYHAGYNKAIDDCKELTFREVVYCDSLNDRTEFRELAEQLKERNNE